MKTQEPKTAGIRCRLYRAWIAATGTASSGHGTQCPDCRAYLLAHGTLENALRRAALEIPRETPAFLESRILRTLKDPQPKTVFPWRPLLSAGAAAALLAMVVMRGGNTVVAPPATELAQTAHPQTQDALAHRVLRVKAEALMDADPLQTEADALLADARDGIRFLQNRFGGLPQEPRSSPR